MFEKVAENLRKLGYTVHCFETAEEATAYLDGEIDGTAVGIGGSVTVAEMGLADRLAAHNRVFWHQGIKDRAESQKMRVAANAAPVYISSVNGLAETGEILNIDGNCNRVASIFYGHERVYLVVGKNKLAPDYDAALWRARNIAAPQNCVRLGLATPCAVKGDRCYNCKSKDRICQGLAVLWGPPMTGHFEVILIAEDLGY